MARHGSAPGEQRLTTAGANRVISRYRFDGRRMALAAVEPSILEVVDLFAAQRPENQQLFAEVVVSGLASKLTGHTATDVTTSQQTRVLGLLRADGEFIAGPPGDARLADGDRLMLFGAEPEIGRSRAGSAVTPGRSSARVAPQPKAARNPPPATRRYHQAMHEPALSEAPARHAWIVFNPSARRAPSESRLREAAEPLRRRGWQVELRSTEAPGDAEFLAREAVAAGASTVVAAGGDGTIHEVVNGLAGGGSALGAIACGTANVWAREIGLPASPKRALALIESGWRTRIDLGEAEGVGESDTPRCFLLMCGAGIDGSVVHAMHGQRAAKRIAGRAAFVPAIGRAVLGARTHPVRIRAGREEFRRELWQAIAGNTRGYSGLPHPTGDARADDGQLDLLLLSGAGRRRQGALIARSLRGGLDRRRPPGVDYLRDSTLAIALDSDAHARLDVQADGEHLGAIAPGSELRLRARPGALIALLPRRPTPLLTTRPPPALDRAGRD